MMFDCERFCTLACYLGHSMIFEQLAIMVLVRHRIGGLSLGIPQKTRHLGSGELW